MIGSVGIVSIGTRSTNDGRLNASNISFDINNLPEVVQYGRINDLKDFIRGAEEEIERLGEGKDPVEVEKAQQLVNDTKAYVAALEASIAQGDTKVEGVSIMGDPASPSIGSVDPNQKTTGNPSGKEPMSGAIPILAGVAVVAIFYMYA